MGNCISSSTSCIGQLVSIPNDGIELTSSEVREIIKEKLNITDNSRIKTADGRFYAITIDDIKRFIIADSTDIGKYKKEIYDCDDFALVLAGRNREWFTKLDIQNASTFGIVIGDIRKSIDDKEPRYHAMNFIIAKDRELYLVEPQNDSIYKPVLGNSKFTFAMC